MTAETIDKISRYANGVWQRDKGTIGLQGCTLDDFKQKMLLCALENPTYPPAMLVKKIRYAEMCEENAVPYKLECMPKFCDLAPAGVDDIDGYIENKYGLGVEDSTEIAENSCIDELAKTLYDREDRQNLFLDYMHGQPIGSGRQRDCREKLFNHRFEILQFLEEHGKITHSQRFYYEELAKIMKNYAPVPRVLSMDKSAINCRKYYHKDIEIKRKRKLNYYYKRKKAFQAENA